MSPAMGWAMLVLSGLLDVGWALATKKSNGLTNGGWAALSAVLLIAFVVTLSRALSVLPLGVAYAVWTGIGAVGSVLVGAFVFGEPLGAQRLVWVAVIVMAIVGLHLGSGQGAG